VAAVLGPAVHDVLWDAACQAAADAGWLRVTVDAFASAANARAPRFWSRFLELGAGAIDALCVLDRAKCRGPTCGSSHREVLEFVCVRRCWPGRMCGGRRGTCQAPWREEYWRESLPSSANRGTTMTPL
jgi:hypothetical protein